MLNFIKKLFSKKSQKPSVQRDDNQPKKVSNKKLDQDYKVAFDKNYWQKYVLDGFMIRQDVALHIAKDIMVNLVHNSQENRHHEVRIINYIERMGSKSNLSMVSFLFNKLYSKDLLEEILLSFDKDSFEKMVDSITKLPN